MTAIPSPVEARSGDWVAAGAPGRRRRALTLGCVLGIPSGLPRPTVAASVQAVGHVWQQKGTVTGKVHVVVETRNQESDVLENKRTFQNLARILTDPLNHPSVPSGQRMKTTPASLWTRLGKTLVKLLLADPKPWTLNMEIKTCLPFS